MGKCYSRVIDGCSGGQSRKGDQGDAIAVVPVRGDSEKKRLERKGLFLKTKTEKKRRKERVD